VQRQPKCGCTNGGRPLLPVGHGRHGNLRREGAGPGQHQDVRRPGAEVDGRVAAARNVRGVRSGALDQRSEGQGHRNQQG